MTTSVSYTAQKMRFSIKDFFSKSDLIRRKLCAVSLWPNLLAIAFWFSREQCFIKDHVLMMYLSTPIESCIFFTHRICWKEVKLFSQSHMIPMSNTHQYLSNKSKLILVNSFVQVQWSQPLPKGSNLVLLNYW